MIKPTKWLYAQRRLRSALASAQSDQPSLCAQWVAKDPNFLHVDVEDSDQTGWMPRLIWVFAGRAVTLVCHVAAQITCIAYLYIECSNHVNFPTSYRVYQFSSRTKGHRCLQIAVLSGTSWDKCICKFNGKIIKPNIKLQKGIMCRSDSSRTLDIVCQ